MLRTVQICIFTLRFRGQKDMANLLQFVLSEKSVMRVWTMIETEETKKSHKTDKQKHVTRFLMIRSPLLCWQ